MSWKKYSIKKNIEYFNEKKYLYQLIARFFLVRLLISFFYKIEYVGKENIPTGKNFIISPNHISYLDPLLVGDAINHPVAYMGKKELFENPIFAKIIDALACFPVNREKLEVSTIKTSLNVLKTNRWRLGIFPQGGINRNKKIEKINKGFAIIAKQTKTDILPVAITGCEKNNWVPFKGKIKLVICEPISYEKSTEEIFNEWGNKISSAINYDFVLSDESLNDA